MRPTTPSQDLYFQCASCAASLVVDRAAAGMVLPCQHCGKPVTVPTFQPTAELVPEREAELRRHLKENESQRTEITGYINQLTIQLHRWQLRLRTLDERNAELQAELAKLPAPVG
jgi:ribosomal protein L37AE/L43A